MRRTLILVLLILMSLPISHASASYETGGVIKTMFSNGVTLFVKPEPESKIAAVDIFVHVGAQDENDTNAGVGQLLAGSILTGTSTRSTRRLARLVAEAGGNFHSLWQWNYIETYAVTLPNACEEAISLLSDSIQNCSLDTEAIEYSRSMILKEMRRQEDDPFNAAYTTLRRQLYRGTPYGRAYLGEPQKIKSITVDQVRSFYERNFNSDRIVVSVVGNVNPESVAHKVEVCFRNMDLVSVDTPKVRPITSARRQLAVEKSGSTTYVMLGYPAPGLEDSEYLPMCVANVLLGGNKSSLLFTRLREERGLGYLVGSQYPPLSGAGHIVTYLGMDSTRATPTAIKTVENAMIEQVKALRDGSFSDKDFERAKRYLIGKHALNHERTGDRAFYLGWAETMGLGYQSDLSVCYTEALNKVTREDIVRVAAQYLNDPTTLVYSGSGSL